MGQLLTKFKKRPPDGNRRTRTRGYFRNPFSNKKNKVWHADVLSVGSYASQENLPNESFYTLTSPSSGSSLHRNVSAVSSQVTSGKSDDTNITDVTVQLVGDLTSERKTSSQNFLLEENVLIFYYNLKLQHAINNSETAVDVEEDDSAPALDVKNVNEDSETGPGDYLNFDDDTSVDVDVNEDNSATTPDLENEESKTAEDGINVDYETAEDADQNDGAMAPDVDSNERETSGAELNVDSEATVNVDEGNIATTPNVENEDSETVGDDFDVDNETTVDVDEDNSATTPDVENEDSETGEGGVNVDYEIAEDADEYSSAMESDVENNERETSGVEVNVDDGITVNADEGNMATAPNLENEDSETAGDDLDVDDETAVDEDEDNSATARNVANEENKTAEGGVSFDDETAVDADEDGSAIAPDVDDKNNETSGIEVNVDDETEVDVDENCSATTPAVENEESEATGVALIEDSSVEGNQVNEADNNSESIPENVPEEAVSVLSLPLAINQNSLGEQVELQLYTDYGYEWPPHVEAMYYRELMSVDGRNACAFLTLMMSRYLLETEQIQVAEIRPAAETIISESPQLFNHRRNISRYYDLYTVLEILRDLNEIPPSSLQECLERNPFRSDLQEDLRAVLRRFWISGERVAAAFVCEPLVFTIFCCNAEGQRWLGIVDTHRVPEALGGNGGGLVLAFGSSPGFPENPVSQLVDWLLLRLELYGIPPNERTSLLSLHLA